MKSLQPTKDTLKINQTDKFPKIRGETVLRVYQIFEAISENTFDVLMYICLIVFTQNTAVQLKAFVESAETSRCFF